MTTKYHSRLIALLSFLGSAMIFSSGYLFKLRNSYWAWLDVLSAAVVAVSQAAIHYTRENLVQTQHKLISREVEKVIHG